MLLSGTHTKVNNVVDKAKLMKITMRNSIRLAQIMKKVPREASDDGKTRRGRPR